MAARDGAGGLQPPGEVWADLHGGRQRQASAGDDPSGTVRIDGAVYRGVDRAFPRGVSGVVGTGAGEVSAGE